MSGDDFFVAPANADAVDWIDMWPDWPGPGLVVHGAAGCGKSHLANVFAAATGATLVDAGMLREAPSSFVESPIAIVIDGADGIVATDAKLQTGMFHLLNAMNSAGKKLLLTGRTPAARWRIELADLLSRLNAFDQIGIAQPDDGLLGVLLVKQFADRQMKIDPDVVSYLVTRMERSTAAVETLVAALDREALAEKRPVTVPLVRRVLEAVMGAERPATD